MVAAQVPTPYRVIHARKESPIVTTLDLAPADQSPTGPFAPGQFSMLYLFGVGEVPISISGDPADQRRITHTIRAVGAVSKGLCHLTKGRIAGVRGPFGSGWPLERARGRDVLLVAGGLGIAPIRSALHALAGHREQYGRVVLVYGVRSPNDGLFSSQLHRWQQVGSLELHLTVDWATPEWRGNVGPVTTLLPLVVPDPGRAMALICGPEIMMRFTAAALERLGFSEDCIYLSMERNMKCAVGLCGHCQFGPEFVCKDGPVFPFSRLRRLLSVREV